MMIVKIIVKHRGIQSYISKWEVYISLIVYYFNFSITEFSYKYDTIFLFINLINLSFLKR